MRVRFGDFTLDSETRELLRGDRPVHLSPKAYRLLELLLENRPRAVPKAELQERIWPDTFVSEANLASLTAEVREAIGEDGQSARFLRTVYGFGYAFSGGATEASRPASAPGRRYCMLDGKREIELVPGENIVGRDVDAAVRLDDPTVSRHHARILVESTGVTVEDLESKNGSFLEGERLRSARSLKSGNTVKFGSVLLTFKTFAPDDSTESVRPE
ncbi:MAG TPA: FHA domain-containing protein [Thermoanaerobaculia bacterium]